jgi:hypothetical protein
MRVADEAVTGRYESTLSAIQAPTSLLQSYHSMAASGHESEQMASVYPVATKGLTSMVLVEFNWGSSGCQDCTSSRRWPASETAERIIDAAQAALLVRQPTTSHFLQID